MSVEETIEITHPGPILRAARDELRLSIEGVADQLHLRPSVVALIESENYADFSNDVFLKGYFRSYCRLVGLHEERMVELLDKQLAAIKTERRQTEKNAADDYARKKRVHALKLAGVASSIIVVCALVITSLIGTSDEAGLQKQSAIESEVSPEVSSDEAISAAVENETESSAVVASNDPELVVDERAVTEQKLSAAELVANKDQNTDVAGVSAPVESDSSAETTVDASQNEGSSSPAEERPEPGESAKITIEFSGECWFESYGYDGQRLKADLMKDGGSYSYEGPKPLRFVFGDGKVVSMRVDGAPYDLQNVIRNSGRAEVVLD